MSNPQRHRVVVDEHAALADVRDGMLVAIGEPAPMALVRALVRRRPRDLTVIATGMALDLLVATGCVARTMTYYAGGGLGVPVAPAFRRAAERGELDVWECEEGILTSGLEAAAKGLPFMPCRGGVGTSIPDLNPALKVFTDPLENQTLIAVPPIRPDLCLLHADAADAFGNVRHCDGPGWLDLFLYRAATRVVVQVERLVSNEDIRRDPWRTTIADADAIVPLRFGAHPYYSRGHYVQDVDAVNAYFAASAEAARARDGTGSELAAWIARYCDEPGSHADYLERVGNRQLLALTEYGEADG